MTNSKSIEDLPWAVERVTSMCASALVDASRLGKKLLKGFGYPDEIFGRAQDYRALDKVLSALALETQRRQEAERALKAEQERSDLIVNAVNGYKDVCQQLAAADQARAEAEQRVRTLTERMRSNRARFQSHPGGADVVWGTDVDNWADELEAALLLASERESQ